MDYTLNRIELRGNVGEDAKINIVGDNRVARFKMATNYTYRDKDGNAVIETTWHNIVAWDGKGMPDLGEVKKGSAVYVMGRVRVSRFTTAEGEERRISEVLASRVQIINPDDFR